MLITQFLGMDIEFVGISKSIAFIGSVLGSIAAAFLGERITIKSISPLAIASGLSMLPIGAVLLFDMPTAYAYVAITAAMFINFMAGWVLVIPAFAHIQTVTPPEHIGKVMSLFAPLPWFAGGLGFLSYGILFERFDSTPWLIVFISTFICVMSALFTRKYFNSNDGKAL